MDRYCQIVHSGLITRGDFHEYYIETLSPQPLHQDEGFLDALALKIMIQFERQPIDETLEIDPRYLSNPDRTKSFYSRLFDINGNHTPEFINIASETLGCWIEEKLESVLYAHMGIPFNSDPAYDVLSVFEEAGTYKLRVVQVKATENDIQGNGSKALTKFEKLENGHYDAELSASLELISSRRTLPPGIITRELKLNRRYRVTIVYGSKPPGVSILTTYGDKVRGTSVRRSSVLVEVEWLQLWKEIARRIYAQLT